MSNGGCRRRRETSQLDRSAVTSESQARDRVGAQGNVDDLRVAVEVERVVAALAADPGLLHSAERRAQVAYVLRVDPAHAGVDGRRDAVGAANVVGPDVRRESVGRRVGKPHRLGLVVERRHDEHGAEDLLAEDAHPLLDALDHGRLEEIAALEPALAGRRRPARSRPQRAPTRRSRSLGRGARGGSAAQARCADRRDRRRGPHAPARRRPRRSGRTAAAATSRREPAVQRWPFSVKICASAASTASSGSASAKTTTGDLPPSSSDTRLSVAAPAAAISRPVALSPVKATRLTPGWAESGAPALSP